MKLRIPPVAAELDPSVETRGVYVEEWIESLPYAHPQTLLKKLHDALHALNRNPVKPSARGTLLEHYLVPYHFLLDLRRKATPPHGGAGIERDRQETAALSALARELAIGYMRALSDGLSRNTLFGRGGELAAATQRACALLACSLAHAWDGYLPAPAESWQELHALYLFARARGTEHQAADSRDGRPELASDTDTSYKRALLCSLVDPYRLPFGDVWRVFDALAGDAGRAELGEIREVTRNVGLFVVTPATPSRPVAALARLDADAIPPDAMLLDANPLVSELQTRLEQLRAAGANGEAGAQISMLGRLIRALGLPPRRHSPRREEGGGVNLVAGLSAIHSMLGGVSVEEVATAPPQEGEVVVEEDGEQHASGVASSTHRYAKALWDVSDRGSGGVGLSLNGRPQALPAVGELTGVQFAANGGGGWSVGVLRWLNMNHDDRYRAGVQLLGDSAVPALVEPSGNGQAAPRPALLLSTGKADSNRSLLVPGGIYRRDGELVLHAEGGRRQVRMDSLLDSSPLFERLSFQAAPDR